MKITRMTVESTKQWANIARREVAGKAVIGIRGDGAAGRLRRPRNGREAREDVR